MGDEHHFESGGVPLSYLSHIVLDGVFGGP